MQERLAIAGSGAIACGLAATAARHGEVVLWARSEASADRARAGVATICGRLSGEVNARHVRVGTDLEALAGASFVVEAIVEDLAAKGELLARLAQVAADDALLATTTSSLSVAALAAASGVPERFAALHVFNPVPRMKLVELAFPAEAGDATRRRARELCEALGKTPVEVPDAPGFVVNRLLFPYLFDAVRLMERSDLSAAGVDDCMRLGAGHPMGPLKLLDFVGLDVSKAIGEVLHEESGEEAHLPPPTIMDLVAAGKLGRKSGQGFYSY